MKDLEAKAIKVLRAKIHFEYLLAKLRKEV